ncbi:MAG: vitamin B12 dependent methionine synthase, partial [Clostridiales bacterium]
LLGEVEKATGVKLAEDLLMVPVKTVSGIRFSLDIDYVNCQLCPREACRGRRAAYDANLYQQKYGLGQK